MKQTTRYTTKLSFIDAHCPIGSLPIALHPDGACCIWTPLKLARVLWLLLHYREHILRCNMSYGIVWQMVVSANCRTIPSYVIYYATSANVYGTFTGHPFWFKSKFVQIQQRVSCFKVSNSIHWQLQIFWNVFPHPYLGVVITSPGTLGNVSRISGTHVF